MKKSEHLIHKSRKNLKFNGYFDRNFKKLYTILDQTKIQSNRVLLSIVLPVYNEENTVRRVLSSLPEHDLVEVVVVDDHSTDKSFEEIETLREDLDLNLIRHSKNGGYAFTTELILSAVLLDYKIKECPIHLLGREHGASYIVLNKLLISLMLCIGLYAIKNIKRLISRR